MRTPELGPRPTYPTKRTLRDASSEEGSASLNENWRSAIKRSGHPTKRLLLSTKHSAGATRNCSAAHIHFPAFLVGREDGNKRLMASFKSGRRREESQSNCRRLAR